MDFRWDIHYSNGVLPDVHTDYSPYYYDLEVPAGIYYTITVTATPRERTYLRVGYGYTQVFDVCSGMAPSPPAGGATGGGGVRPDAHLQCPPAGPPDP